MKNQTRLLIILLIFVLCALVTGCGGSTPVDTELYYDNSADTSIGEYGGIATTNMECCVIFDATKLASYVGGQIIAIKLYNPDTVDHSYTPEVFEADAGVNPPTLISANTASTTISSKTWQTITLDTPVTIQSGKVYWNGYKIVSIVVTDYPLAVGSNTDYGNNRQRNSVSGLFGTVSYNWMVKIIVRK